MCLFLFSQHHPHNIWKRNFTFDLETDLLQGRRAMPVSLWACWRTFRAVCVQTWRWTKRFESSCDNVTHRQVDWFFGPRFTTFHDSSHVWTSLNCLSYGSYGDRVCPLELRRGSERSRDFRLGEGRSLAHLGTALQHLLQDIARCCKLQMETCEKRIVSLNVPLTVMTEMRGKAKARMQRLARCRGMKLSEYVNASAKTCCGNKNPRATSMLCA